MGLCAFGLPLLLERAWGEAKNAIIQKQQILICRGEEHAGNILGTLVKLHPEQFARPVQILLLAQFGLALKYQVIAGTSRTLFQQQQSQLVLLAEYAHHHGLHLLPADVVDVHTYRGAHAGRPFQRAVVVGQTRVVHLHQSALSAVVTTAHRLDDALLLATVTQRQILLSCGDGAHHLRPILIIYHVYAHSPLVAD